MRWLIAFALALALTVAVACDGNGDGAPTPEGETALELGKNAVETGEGEFVFTLTLENTGDNTGVNVDLSDVWEEGLEVTDVSEVDGEEPELILDQGVEFIMTEMEPGKRISLGYAARCKESGTWTNTAVVSAVNAEAVEASVEVECP